MFHTKIRGGKVFAAEQKIRRFKKILQKSKRMHSMKKRSLLAKKMEPFYEEIETKRDSKEQKDSNRFGIQTKGDSKVKLKIQYFNVSY